MFERVKRQLAADMGNLVTGCLPHQKKTASVLQETLEVAWLDCQIGEPLTSLVYTSILYQYAYKSGPSFLNASSRKALFRVFATVHRIHTLHMVY